MSGNCVERFDTMSIRKIPLPSFSLLFLALEISNLSAWGVGAAQRVASVDNKGENNSRNRERFGRPS